LFARWRTTGIMGDAEGQTVAGSRVGLSDRIIQVTAGAATAVRNAVRMAAGLAVSAPAALVDPQTRQSLGEHADEFGWSASDVAARCGTISPEGNMVRGKIRVTDPSRCQP
jgi:hypothetical protein